MTEPGKLPTSGYVFDRVYTNNLAMRVTALKEDAPSEPPLLFSWDWKLLSPDRKTFEVLINVGVDPSVKRQEELRVTICGRFRAEGDHQEVSLENFVRFHAPAILMPFARETISNLTTRGFYDTLVLPPLNVQMLMERQDLAATTGAKQLMELNANPQP
jgi:preprotein translocase subunit SecB